jgi:hypothetical protein
MSARGSIATRDRRSVFVGSTLRTDRRGRHGATPALCHKETHAPQQSNCAVQAIHSITSLARASSDIGIVRPSVFAVLGPFWRLSVSAWLTGLTCSPYRSLAKMVLLVLAVRDRHKPCADGWLTLSRWADFLRRSSQSICVKTRDLDPIRYEEPRRGIGVCPHCPFTECA